MPLILAIEPDKRQSTQLASVVKGLQAELVQRSSAADALEALQDRVPDLVLTSSLISPRDDAALAARLRELGPAAAHVQTVTIPLLGTAAPTRARGGVLAALRREKPQAPMTDGCAPDVFADQIRQYLATAEEQKASTATRVAATPEAVTAHGATPLVAAESLESGALEPAAFEPAAFETESVDPIAADETSQPAEALPADDIDEAQAAADVPMSAAEERGAPEHETPVEEPRSIVEEPQPVLETVETAAFETAELVADEPAGLPLSELLHMVSATAPAAEAEPLIAGEPLVVPEPAVELEHPTAGGLYVDPVAAQALDELSRQAPQASLVDGIAAEAPVPVVEMRSFQSLDSIASELAAGPSPRYESLDDLAGLFAAAPAPRLPRHEAAPSDPAAHEFTAPPRGDESLFASLFAKPLPSRPAEPIEVPGIDPSLFASAPAASTPACDLAPAAAPPIAFEVEALDAIEIPERLFETAPEPLASTAPEPVVEAVAPVVEAVEPLVEAVAPVVEAVEPVFEALAPVFEDLEPVAAIGELPVETREPEMDALPEPVVAVAAEPVLDEAPEPALEPAAAPEPSPEDAIIACEPVAFEPVAFEPAAFEPVTFEPAAFEPACVEPVAVAAAAPPDVDEEIAIDVDSLAAALVEPVPDASQTGVEPVRFAFTFVEGFGDALSDFEVPSVAGMAADLGVGTHAPHDPYAAVPRAPQLMAAPALDEEALSMIGDAARKVGLDALVIEEFERGLQPRVKKSKKKNHAGATAVAPERPAKPARRPVQDEWGMFDPEQCGFAALEDEEAESRPTSGTRVRVISY